jgi:hypothetical protein
MMGVIVTCHVTVQAKLELPLVLGVYTYCQHPAVSPVYELANPETLCVFEFQTVITPVYW